MPWYVAMQLLSLAAQPHVVRLVAEARRETPEATLAELARGTLRKKLPALREALHGRFSRHHALLVGAILTKLDFLDEVISDLSAEIARVNFAAVGARTPAALDALVRDIRRDRDAAYARL